MALRILKSLAVATVIGVVSVFAYILGSGIVDTLMHPHYGLGARAFDPVSLFRYDKLLWLIVAGSFCLALAYCMLTFRSGRSLPLPLLTAVSTFLVTAATGALFFVSLPGPSPDPAVKQMWPTVILMWSGTIGTFGFLAGVAGGAWLARRRPAIHSTGRLVAESAAAGIALGWLIGLLWLSDATLYSSGTTPPPRLLQIALLSFCFCALPGCLFAILVALLLRRRILTPTSA